MSTNVVRLFNPPLWGIGPVLKHSLHGLLSSLYYSCAPQRLIDRKVYDSFQKFGNSVDDANRFNRKLTKNGIVFPFAAIEQSEEVISLISCLFQKITGTKEKFHFEKVKQLFCKELVSEFNQQITYPIFIKNNHKCLYITRLQVATLLENFELIYAYTKIGYHPNEEDNQGYTALHFAAMIDRIDVLYLLWRLGGSLKKKTHQGLSVYDVLKARGFTQNSRVYELISRKYLEDNIYTTDALFVQWRSFIVKKEDNKEAFATYDKIKEGKLAYDPPVYAQKMGPDSPLNGQLELRASRIIQEGEFVVEYTGYVTTDNPSSDYVMEAKSLSIDAKKGGSFAELANHSFPNCQATSYKFKGLDRTLLIAATTILKDEPLFIDYGFAYFTGRKPVELNPDGVRRFVTETSGLSNFDQYKNKNYLRHAKEYLYAFPEELFKLVEQKKLNPDNLKWFFGKCLESGLTDNVEIKNLKEYHEALLLKTDEILHTKV